MVEEEGEQLFPQLRCGQSGAQGQPGGGVAGEGRLAFSGQGLHLPGEAARVEKADHAVFRFILEVRSNDHLKDIIARLKNIKNITNVYKLNEKVILK